MKKTKNPASLLNPQRTPRERRMDKNTVARPKRTKVVAWTGDPETVEQFQARGGKVQRLSANWEQAA